MGFCYAIGCNHSGKDCKMFKFPVINGKIDKSWQIACRRADKPTFFSQLCSCHFVDGKKESGPSIFDFSAAMTRKSKKRLLEGEPEDEYEDNFELDEATPSVAKTAATPSPLMVFNVPEHYFTKNENYFMETQPEVDEEDSDEFDEAPHYSGWTAAEKILKKKMMKQNEELKQGHKTHKNASPWNVVGKCAEKQMLKQNEELKQKLKTCENALTFEAVKLSDRLVYEYTGLPTNEHVTLLLRLLQRFPIKLNYFSGNSVVEIRLVDQLLCTLMKLRLNLTTFDLAYRFKTNSTTIHNIVTTIMYALHAILFDGMMGAIPSREKNLLSLPSCFISFPNCRIVLDCVEIEVAEEDKQKAVFFNNRERYTLKALVGVSPNTAITYVSKLYPGSASDKNIAIKCGILSQLVAGDLILAGRGFIISDMCSQLGVSVEIPPFLQTAPTPHEISKTARIARARSHAGRAIKRLKAFRILDRIPASMMPHATIVVQTCAALVNMQYSHLAENEQCAEE